MKIKFNQKEFSSVNGAVWYVVSINQSQQTFISTSKSMAIAKLDSMRACL